MGRLERLNCNRRTEQQSQLFNGYGSSHTRNKTGKGWSEIVTWWHGGRQILCRTEKVPLRDQISLAEKIASDKKMKEIADWAGRFKQVARKKQKTN